MMRLQCKLACRQWVYVTIPALIYSLIVSAGSSMMASAAPDLHNWMIWILSLPVTIIMNNRLIVWLDSGAGLLISEPNQKHQRYWFAVMLLLHLLCFLVPLSLLVVNNIQRPSSFSDFLTLTLVVWESHCILTLLMMVFGVLMMRQHTVHPLNTFIIIPLFFPVVIVMMTVFKLLLSSNVLMWAVYLLGAASVGLFVLLLIVLPFLMRIGCDYD